MSVSQWTPQMSLPVTMNAEKTDTTVRIVLTRNALCERRLT